MIFKLDLHAAKRCSFFVRQVFPLTTLAVALCPDSSLALPSGVKKVASGTLIEGTPQASLFQFKNGLKLIVLPDHRNPVATLRLRLDGGSNREEPGITGLAHFFEHMMFRKTKGQPEGQFDKTLSGIGGSGNAATSTNFVVYNSTFPGPALDIMLDLEMKRFRQLDLTDPYFTTEKGAVISERRLRYENNPLQRGLEHIRRITQRGTQREWLTIGTREDVENMSIAQAQKFYKDHYVPENTLISVGGPFDVNSVVKKVHKKFGDWSGTLKARERKNPQDILTRDSGKNFVCKEAVNEQIFQIVFPSTKTSYNDLLMAHIFSELLDDHDEGAFSRRLNNKNLASAFGFYKVYWQHGFQPVQAYFSLSREQDFQKALGAFRSEVERLKKLNWGKEFRERLQKSIEVDKAEAAEKMTSLVESYEWNQSYYGDFLISKSFQKVVDELSVQQLREWMNSTLDFKKAYIMGVTHSDRHPPCEKLTVAGTKL